MSLLEHLTDDAILQIEDNDGNHLEFMVSSVDIEHDMVEHGSWGGRMARASEGETTVRMTVQRNLNDATLSE